MQNLRYVVYKKNTRDFLFFCLCTRIHMHICACVRFYIFSVYTYINVYICVYCILV